MGAWRYPAHATEVLRGALGPERADACGYPDGTLSTCSGLSPSSRLLCKQWSNMAIWPGLREVESFT